MSNTENTNSPDAALSEVLRKEHEAEALRKEHKAEILKIHEAAVEAELRHWAQLFTGRLLCDCCERTVEEVGEPCRKSFKQVYRGMRHRYDNDAGFRNIIDSSAEERFYEEQTSRPKDMTAQ